MKLLFCLKCHDLLRLHPQDGRMRHCDCGKSSGTYLDGKVAKFAGPCVPMGVDNESLARVIRVQNTLLTPFKELEVPLFRFRTGSKNIQISTTQKAQEKREVDRLLELFEGARKVK